jgi:NitT/TauT family transport system permease protein
MTTYRPAPAKQVRRYAPLLTLLVVLLLWQLATLFVPPSLIPAPLAVFEKFVQVLQDGRLMRHTGVTLSQVLIGLTVGVSIGATLGYLIAHSPLLEDLLSPVIVTLQSTPVVAYAPLLVIWFGSGPTSKIITGVLIVFFPMLMNTVVGIRSVPRNLHDLMKVHQATRWQIFTKLEVPAALPVLFTGLKTAATLAVIGAVVGEFINASAGLGFLIISARTTYDTPLVFVCVIALAAMALSLYGIAALVERRLVAWKRF